MLSLRSSSLNGVESKPAQVHQFADVTLLERRGEERTQEFGPGSAKTRPPKLRVPTSPSKWFRLDGFKPSSFFCRLQNAAC